VFFFSLCISSNWDVSTISTNLALLGIQLLFVVDLKDGLGDINLYS